MLAQAVGLAEILVVLLYLLLVVFLGWVWWAYTPRHKAMMDEAALLPFTDGD